VGFVVKPDKSRYFYSISTLLTRGQKRWEELASEGGVPLSKFVIEIVENALKEESEFKPRAEMIKEPVSTTKNSRAAEADDRYRQLTDA